MGRNPTRQQGPGCVCVCVCVRARGPALTHVCPRETIQPEGRSDAPCVEYIYVYEYIYIYITYNQRSVDYVLYTVATDVPNRRPYTHFFF